MEDSQIRSDEIEALSSIYGDDWKCENETNTNLTMQINKDVKLHIYLNENYPEESPPTYLLQAPYFTKEEKANVDQCFSEIYLNNIGNPIIYEWIEKLKELASSINVETEVNEVPMKLESEIKYLIPKNELKLLIHHGDQITDRKSTFQAHACTVNSQADVDYAKEFLLQSKKIAQATHNILAYRIVQENNVTLQDYDDDGETNAGSRLLHLLQVLDLKNVMVVVSRWYGGIHLGPDRFKHINNAARNALVKANMVK